MVSAYCTVQSVGLVQGLFLFSKSSFVVSTTHIEILQILCEYVTNYNYNYRENILHLSRQYSTVNVDTILQYEHILCDPTISKYSIGFTLTKRKTIQLRSFVFYYITCWFEIQDCFFKHSLYALCSVIRKEIFRCCFSM